MQINTWYQRRLNLYTILYKEKIKHIRNQISKGTYDSETLEMADEIYHDISNKFTVDFYEFVKRNEKSIKRLIRKYRNRAILLGTINHILQFILIVGSVLVPFMIYFSNIPKTIPIITSALVALAAALTKYYKFGEHIINFKTALEKTQTEFNLYDTGRGAYVDLEEGEALDLIMDNIDEIRHEQNELSLRLEKGMQDQDRDLEKIMQDQISSIRKAETR